jgi:protein O-GlcNAc transferase
VFLIGCASRHHKRRDWSDVMASRHIRNIRRGGAGSLDQAIAAHQAGDQVRAESLCKLVLAKDKNHFDALHLMALIKASRGEFGEALTWIDRCLRANPQSAEAHMNRGRLLNELQRHEEALESYGRALAISPDNFLALHNRGSTSLTMNRFSQAIADFERVLEINPHFLPARHNRSVALNELGRHVEALQACDDLLAIDPRFVPSRYNRSLALTNLGRHAEALAACEEVLAINRDYPDAVHLRGIILMQLNQEEAAIAEFERALRLAPAIDYARGDLTFAKLRCCRWDNIDRDIEQVVADVRAGKRTISPFSLLAISDTPRDQLLCARSFVAVKCPATPNPIWRNERYRHSRIKIGYLSATLHDHAVPHLMLGMFERHDHSRFETVAFSYGPDTADDVRARLKSAFDQFIDVRQDTDGEVAHLMRELEIDIAVDLMGFIRDCRPGIMALRPAPLQVNYLGYPGTLGASYFDYIFGDQVTIPDAERGLFDEKVVQLPDTYLPSWQRSLPERMPTRSECALPENGIVFCSFNNSYKIRPQFFDIWMRLLRAVDGSVLWLLASNAAVAANLRREAEARGVAQERLVLAPQCKAQDHLSRHRLADICLDNLPYCAHTTASDALWTGTPLVTCIGTTFAGRVAASALEAVGLPELITRSQEDYEALALKLARDPDLLADIKAKLWRQRTSAPLFDADRYTRHVESAYATMYERHQRGEAPEGFAVAALGDG